MSEKAKAELMDILDAHLWGKITYGNRQDIYDEVVDFIELEMTFEEEEPKPIGSRSTRRCPSKE